MYILNVEIWKGFFVLDDRLSVFSKYTLAIKINKAVLFSKTVQVGFVLAKTLKSKSSLLKTVI